MTIGGVPDSATASDHTPSGRAGEPAVNPAVIAGHRQGQPLLQFSQCENSFRVTVVGTALARIGERRARQFVHHLHHGADHTLDNAAVVRLSRRSVLQSNTVLCTPATQGLAFELCSIVEVELAGFAAHRPHRVHAESFQPRPLVGHGVRQTQSDRCCRGRLQRHDKPDDAPTHDVDRCCQIRPANRQTVPLIDDDHIDRSVIDLNSVQNPVDCGWVTAGGLSSARGVLRVSGSHGLFCVQLRNPSLDRAARRCTKTTNHALPFDISKHRRRSWTLPCQISRLEHEANDGFHLVGEPFACTPSAGLSGKKRGDDATACTPFGEQEVYLTS